MNHRDHVALIRAGVEPVVESAVEPVVDPSNRDGAPTDWLELGAGDGEFTLALADALGGTGAITALDRDSRALATLERRVRASFPRTDLATVTADFTAGLPLGPFAGVLAANSLHFVRDVVPVLRAIHDVLEPGGRLVLVEYDADDGNRWVPYPISFRRWQGLAPRAGFDAPVRIHRVPSRFLGSIYGAVATRAS